MKNTLTKNLWYPVEDMPDYKWLTDAYVLTQAIKSKFNNYTLKLIKQELADTPADDQQALKNTNQQSFIRRVLQSGDCIPLCYARTTIPLITFEKFRTEFESLGEKPIGETLLYKNPDVKRSEFEICCLTKENSLLFEANQAADKNHTKLWARRSIFWMSSYPLLISEVFLSDFRFK